MSTVSELNAAVWTGFLAECRFAIGDQVRFLGRGAERYGRVCGFYSTAETHVGVCVLDGAGRVRVFPQERLELVRSVMDLPR